MFEWHKLKQYLAITNLFYKDWGSKDIKLGAQAGVYLDNFKTQGKGSSW